MADPEDAEDILDGAEPTLYRRTMNRDTDKTYMTLLPPVQNTRIQKPEWLRYPALYMQSTAIIIEHQTRTQEWAGVQSSVPLTSAARARDCAAVHLARLPFERMLALLLTDDYLLFGLANIGQGDTQRSVTNLRTLTAICATHPVAAVILAHNHPHDGVPHTPKPSQPDKRMTRSAALLLNELSVQLLDHLILPSCWDTEAAPFWAASQSEPQLLVPFEFGQSC